MENIHAQFMELNAACKEIDALYSRLAERSALSDAMLWCMYVVCAAEGDCAPKDVCGMFAMCRQTVHSALKKLESQGYIALVAAPEDRRSKRIVLTEKGLRCKRELFEPLFQTEAAALAQMAPEDRAALLQGTREYLNTFRPAMERLLRQPPPRDECQVK